MSFQRFTMLGHMTRDPEMRYTPKGTAIAEFGVAANRKWKGEDGEPKEEVFFGNWTAFGKTAEFIGQYAKKGEMVYVEGRLKLEEWEDNQTGQKRKAIKCIVEKFLSTSKRQGGGQESGGYSRPASTGGGKPQQNQPSDNDGSEPQQYGHGAASEDDVPF